MAASSRTVRVGMYRRRLRSEHPLAAGLQCLVAPVVGLQQLDDLTGIIRTVTTTPTWVPNAMGGSARDFATSNATSADVAFTSGPYSVAAWFNLPVTTVASTTSVWTRSNYTNESSNAGWGLQFRPDEGSGTLLNGYSFTCFNNNGILTYRFGGSIAPSIGAHLLVGTSTGGAAGTRRMYVDGRLAGTLAGSQSSAAASTSNLRNTTGPLQIPLYAGYAWNRALSDREVNLMWADPLGMLERRRSHVGWTAALAGASAGGPFPFFTRAAMAGGMSYSRGGVF